MYKISLILLFSFLLLGEMTAQAQVSDEPFAEAPASPELTMKVTPERERGSYNLQWNAPANPYAILTIHRIDGVQITKKNLPKTGMQRLNFASYGHGVYIISIRTHDAVKVKKVAF